MLQGPDVFCVDKDDDKNEMLTIFTSHQHESLVQERARNDLGQVFRIVGGGCIANKGPIVIDLQVNFERVGARIKKTNRTLPPTNRFLFHTF